MSSRVPGGRLCVVSFLHALQHHAFPTHRALIRIVTPSHLQSLNHRRFQSSKPTHSYSIDYSPRLALQLVESRAQTEPLNPPRSVLPPLLQLPVRSSDENRFAYLFRLGKAYASFYKDGVKAVWFNHKAAVILKKRIAEEFRGRDEAQVMAQGLITRAEAQLLWRDRVDMGKLPVFALLVVVFGEWLPLIVPWMPSRVPGTCRIPSQVQGMRFAAQERRNRTFRSGVKEPSSQQIADFIKADDTGRLVVRLYCDQIAAKLRPEQLRHISASLGLHHRFWDVLQLSPPPSSLRSKVAKRIHYLALDDSLLRRWGKDGPAKKLSPDELSIACEERGMDVLGKRDMVLQSQLDQWVQRQSADATLLTMLFRR